MIVGQTVSFISSKYITKKKIKNENHDYIEISLFLTGLVSYILLEKFGLTKIYCQEICNRN